MSTDITWFTVPAATLEAAPAGAVSLILQRELRTDVPLDDGGGLLTIARTEASIELELE